MTELDIHNLQTKKIKITITWAAIWVCITIVGTVGLGVFKLGSIWEKQQNRINTIEKTANDALIKSSVNQVSISETSKRVDEHSYKIKYLERVIKN